MNIIFTVFLVFWVLHLICELVLESLNLSNIQKNSKEIPSFFAEWIDRDSYLRSVQYSKVKGRLAVISTIYGSMLLMIFIVAGWFGEIDLRIQAAVSHPLTAGVVYLICLGIGFTLLDLPLSLYSTFVVEERFGFNNTTFRLWFVDLVKGLIVTGVILTPVLYLLLWFMRATGEWWWLYGFFALALFQLGIMFIYPVLIAPLFNKFSPLEPGALRESILNLAEKARFKTSGVFIMDGSRRSTHGNAYFIGIGANKRIVLFDTLVDELEVPQAVAVLAHEIGHSKRGHIRKSLVLSLFLTLVGFWLLHQLMLLPEFFAAFGFTQPSNHAALAIFSFAATPFIYFLSPLTSMLSRKFEYEADRYAIDLVGNATDLSMALLTLSKRSLSNLTPHPLYSFFHYSHPTLAERLRAMQLYSGGA